MERLAMSPAERQMLRVRLAHLQRVHDESRRASWPTAAVLLALAVGFAVVAWKIEGVFVGACAVVMVALGARILLNDRDLRRQRDAMQRDLDDGHKHLLRAPVEARTLRSLRRGRQHIHALTVAGRSYQVKPGDYLAVAEGDAVCLHLACASQAVLRVDPAPDDACPSTSPALDAP